MTELIIGAYWKNRPLSLQEYATMTTAFLTALAGMDTLFHSISWVGDKRGEQTMVTGNAAALTALIYQHAGGDGQIFDNANPNGSPTWESKGWRGFSMIYNNGVSSKAGGVTISIRAGKNDPGSINAVTIAMGIPNKSKMDFNTSNCHELIKSLFLSLVTFWHCDKGMVYTDPFSDVVFSEQITEIGWLTYLKNTNASAMRNNPDLIAAGIEMEPVSIGGTLFSIDREMVSPDNEVQVARAKLLRAKLMENKLIDN